MKLENQVNVVKSPWKNSPYYEDAEKWTHIFWDDNTVFRRYFDQLDLTNVVELACGYGRHSEKVASKAGALTLIDVFDENLAKCRRRLSSYKNVDYILGNGFDFMPFQNSQATSVFCYDAMVHFSMDIILSYLSETCRILKSGGMALYHHSNYYGPQFSHYGQHPHARNIMDFNIFSNKANELGLSIISTVIDWGGVHGLDRVSLLKKK